LGYKEIVNRCVGAAPSLRLPLFFGLYLCSWAIWAAWHKKMPTRWRASTPAVLDWRL
jgi:hypothetical protein